MFLFFVIFYSFYCYLKGNDLLGNPNPLIYSLPLKQHLKQSPTGVINSTLINTTNSYPQVLLVMNTCKIDNVNVVITKLNE